MNHHVVSTACTNLDETCWLTRGTLFYMHFVCRLDIMGRSHSHDQSFVASNDVTSLHVLIHSSSLVHIAASQPLDISRKANYSSHMNMADGYAARMRHSHLRGWFDDNWIQSGTLNTASRTKWRHHAKETANHTVETSPNRTIGAKASHHKRIIITIHCLCRYVHFAFYVTYLTITMMIIGLYHGGSLQGGPWPTQNFGRVGHNALGPTNIWSMNLTFLA